MVGIVAVTRFCESGHKAFSAYINYIDRGTAVRTDNAEKFDLFEDYTEYMDDHYKDISSPEHVSALFTRDADSLDKNRKKELKELFSKAQSNGSNMWQTVISFDNDYLGDLGIYDAQTNTLNEKILRQAARRAVTDMLKSESLENAVWTAAIHYNTDNIHIHIATVEPTPMRERRMYAVYETDENGELPTDDNGKPIKKQVLDANGNPVFHEAYKGTFEKKSIEALKSGMRNEIENTQSVHREITRLLRQNIIADKKEMSLIDTPEFSERMKKLMESLRDSGIPPWQWKYNMNRMSPYKAKIDDISDFFIQTYHKDDYDELLSKIESEAAKQDAAYGGKGSRYIDNILYGKEGLYARLGNAVLEELRTYDQYVRQQMLDASAALKKFDKNNLFYNPEEGFTSLTEQIKRGNIYAMRNMGIVYLKGTYVERDENKAVAYIRQAADRGDEYAQKFLKKMSEPSDFRSGSRFSSYLTYSGNKQISAHDIRRGIRSLERNLEKEYLKTRNMMEYELLQKEIQSRGHEPEL